MTRFAEDLRSLRFSPAADLPDDDFVARVMTACTLEPERAVAAAPQRSRWLAWSLGSMAAAAACLATFALNFPHKKYTAVPTPLPPGLVARGNADAGLAATAAFVKTT